ncbi:response regulator transcription factor [Nocardioides sp. GXQ0305]|uniref:response regulator transcription factor n=1 Tax=Nocardioides sp. GXQ0305 TaxID=3423912 RepID=UPI003D7E706F
MTRGLTSMFAGHSTRVEYVPPHPNGSPNVDVDITLHDSLADLSSGFVDRLRLPRSHGGELVTWTWNARPRLAEIVLSHGVRGCLSKSLPTGALIAALEAVHRGEVVVECGSPRRTGTQGVPLTPREAEIISLITQGLDNFTIARDLCLSINSVKTYIRTAYQKMGVGSRSQAVLWGVRNGYLDPADVSPAARGLTG